MHASQSRNAVADLNTALAMFTSAGLRQRSRSLALGPDFRTTFSHKGRATHIVTRAAYLSIPNVSGGPTAVPSDVYAALTAILGEEYSSMARDILKIIHAESSFKLLAVSGTGAIGLFQILPTTAPWASTSKLLTLEGNVLAWVEAAFGPGGFYPQISSAVQGATPNARSRARKLAALVAATPRLPLPPYLRAIYLVHRFGLGRINKSPLAEVGQVNPGPYSHPDFRGEYLRVAQKMARRIL